MGAKPLPHGMPIDEGVDLADELRVPPRFEVGVDPFLEHAEPLLFEPHDLGLGEGLELHVGERRAAPDVERLAKAARAL